MVTLVGSVVCAPYPSIQAAKLLLVAAMTIQLDYGISIPSRLLFTKISAISRKTSACSSGGASAIAGSP